MKQLLTLTLVFLVFALSTAVAQKYQVTNLVVYNKVELTSNHTKVNWKTLVTPTYVEIQTDEQVCLLFQFDSWVNDKNSPTTSRAVHSNGEIVWAPPYEVLTLKFPDEVWELYVTRDFSTEAEIYRQIKKQ